MKNNLQRRKYILSDFLLTNFSWFIFNVIRYNEVGKFDGYSSLYAFLTYNKVALGQLLIPFFWLILHYCSGYYNKCLEKSRLSELFITFRTILLGSVFLFFVVLLNSLPQSFHVYYEQFFTLFSLTFFFVYLGRLVITQKATSEIRKREWTIKAIILGVGEKANIAYSSLQKPSHIMAYTIKGGVDTDIICPSSTKGENHLPILGKLEDLGQLIEKYEIEELIVAIDTEDDKVLLELLYSLYQYKLPIKLPVSYFNMLTGGLKINAIAGVPLIDVTDNNFPQGEKNVKEWMDRVISFLVLLLLSPVYLYLMIRTKTDSPGPIFLKQERIGYRGKPFMMYKFRTMIENAEENGPSLSSKEDPRITSYGKIMRKYRLDELPQFWNVLKGDMALVGPRPERKYYIDQIVKRAPYYYLLHNVRPGITSWGMVKYGYAMNVDQMIERAQYDILYYENMSILMDLKIMIYTVRTILTGKGL